MGHAGQHHREIAAAVLTAGKCPVDITIVDGLCLNSGFYSGNAPSCAVVGAWRSLYFHPLAIVYPVSLNGREALLVEGMLGISETARAQCVGSAVRTVSLYEYSPTEWNLEQQARRHEQ